VGTAETTLVADLKAQNVAACPLKRPHWTYFLEMMRQQRLKQAEFDGRWMIEPVVHSEELFE
jgi:hypothetical protein